MPARKRPTVYIIFAALLAVAAAREAGAQVALPPVDDVFDQLPDRRLDPLDRRLDPRARREAREAREAAKAAEEDAESVTEAAGTADAAAEALEDPGANELLEAGASSVAGTAGQLAGGAAQLVPALPRPFAAGLSPEGRPVEKGVRVLLLPEGALPGAPAPGIEVLARRTLPSLGAELVTLRGDDAAALEAAIELLRQSHPELVAEYNHVFRFATEAPGAAGAGGQADAPVDSGADAVDAPLRIGMIDSAVEPDHPLLRDSPIVERDFVLNEGTRPRDHGTAVASLIAARAAAARIYAASVFFQTPDHTPGATTESLVTALDWLAGEGIDVINMSLAGPPDELLGRVLSGLDGPVIVAAVGNNGPSGEPLYPAAYEGVIGVTAVDRDKRIFRYANRGDQVDYAAVGVNVRVAVSGGGLTIQSGTSMASPLVAAIIGKVLQSADLSTDELQAALAAGCEDLGRKGFDPVYGHGLITEPPGLLSRIQKLAPTLTE